MYRVHQFKTKLKLPEVVTVLFSISPPQAKGAHKLSLYFRRINKP